MSKAPDRSQDKASRETATNTSLAEQQRTWTIGELARLFEVTPRTIRFYEQEGLLSPQRIGQKRIYRTRDRVRLKLTLRGKRLGFSLAEIREVITMYDAMPGGNARQLQRLLEILAQRREELDRQLEDIHLMRMEIDNVDQRARDALHKLDQPD